MVCPKYSLKWENGFKARHFWGFAKNRTFYDGIELNLKNRKRNDVPKILNSRSERIFPKSCGSWSNSMSGPRNVIIPKTFEIKIKVLQDIFLNLVHNWSAGTTFEQKSILATRICIFRWNLRRFRIKIASTIRNFSPKTEVSQVLTITPFFSIPLSFLL